MVQQTILNGSSDLQDQSSRHAIEHYCWSCEEVHRFAWVRDEIIENRWRFEIYRCVVCQGERRFAVS